MGEDPTIAFFQAAGKLYDGQAETEETAEEVDEEYDDDEEAEMFFW